MKKANISIMVISVVLIMLGGMTLDTEGTMLPFVVLGLGILGVCADYALYWKKRI